MDKRRLHHLWIRVRGIKPGYFLAIAAVCGVVCAFALRSNNLHMVHLREAVYTADKENGDIETALRDLRIYVYSHMNTNLASGEHAVHPPIQLQYTYERLTKAQSAGASAGNTEVYAQAQQYCEKAIPNGFSGSFRLSCIQTYVKQHGITTPQTIPKNLYQFDFVSAKWSPDLAGWSLLATIFFALCALASWLFHNVIRHLLKR
jgi:hypothetical protein